jgi:DNA-binding FadR family transcriptional regulator
VERIVDGELEPGEGLPKEEALAAEFSMSRGVAREAIRALQERGLVRVTHGRGQRVADESDWKVLDADVLAGMLSRPHAGDLIDQLIECRLLCEVEAAGFAARRASAAERAAIAERAAALVARSPRERPSARAEAVAAERAFHEAILAAAHNRPLAQMLRPVVAALEQAADRLPPRKAALTELRRVGRRDPGARRARHARRWTRTCEASAAPCGARASGARQPTRSSSRPLTHCSRRRNGRSLGRSRLPADRSDVSSTPR